MQLLNDKKECVGILTGFKQRKIVKTLDSGDKELTFEYPVQGNMVRYLKEEYYIRTKEDEYVIRKKKTGTQFHEYTAQLNVEELEGQVFPYGFTSKEQTIRACLEFAFEGTGWQVGVCDINKKRTINKDEETTAWDILQDCLSTYRCECEIHSLTKTIDIYVQIGADRGRYFIEGLNLKKLTVSSDTYDFFTRIIPLGKDDIGIEWLTGKPYIENYQYSSKIKTHVWKDERYTNTTSLIEDATAKLEEMSKPYVSYEADVIDLAKLNDTYQSVLDFDIGDTVWMVSKSTHVKEKQRIVKLTQYPETPQKNTVELSNVTKTFAEIQKEAEDRAKVEAVQIANGGTKKILQEGYWTKEEVETHITASEEKIELAVSKTYETKETVSKMQAKIELTAEQIVQEVKRAQGQEVELAAAIKINADDIELKVSKNNIIQQINLSNEGLCVDASKIDLNGVITANGKFKILLDGSMEATGAKFSGNIEGSTIKAGTIEGAHIKTGYLDGTRIFFTASGELSDDPQISNGKGGIVPTIGERWSSMDIFGIDELILSTSRSVENGGKVSVDRVFDIGRGATFCKNDASGYGWADWYAYGMQAGSIYAQKVGKNAGMVIENRGKEPLLIKSEESFIQLDGTSWADILEVNSLKVGTNNQYGYGFIDIFYNTILHGSIFATEDAIAIESRNDKDIAINADAGSGIIRYYGNFVQNSSKRYKKNISQISKENADLILKLNPVGFNYKASGRHCYGLVAEEVDRILPEIVNYDNAGKPDGVSYIELIPLIIKQVQLLAERIKKDE